MDMEPFVYETDRDTHLADDAAEELLKVTDIWSYFDTSAGRKAKCIVCKTTLENEYDELKAHLKDNHPKLLLQILQDNDQKSEAGSNNDDDDGDNAYTEVVYLEQDPAIENVIKIKEKPKSYPKPIKKRERPVSFHTEEIPAKIAKEDDELETFIKYIRVLLKKLPEDVFSNVQAEIINTILKAQASNSANTSRSLNTSYNTITVDGITPVANTISVGQNYTITVAPPTTTDNEEEKVDS